MKEHGFARGSQQSRRDCFGSFMCAPCAALLLLCACSGSTDVIGVLPTDVETGALEGAASSNGSGEAGEGIQGESAAPGGFSIVAGMPVTGWDDRAALEWPFAVSLDEFFEEGSRADRLRQPPRLERQVVAIMGPSARAERVRVVAPAPEIAERLRDAFAEADVEVELDGDMMVSVMRDWRADEYRVALGSTSCVFSPSHHGGPSSGSRCAPAPVDGFEHP